MKKRKRAVYATLGTLSYFILGYLAISNIKFIGSWLADTIFAPFILIGLGVHGTTNILIAFAIVALVVWTILYLLLYLFGLLRRQVIKQ